MQFEKRFIFSRGIEKGIEKRILALALCVLVAAGMPSVAQAQGNKRLSPKETVQKFYELLRQKNYREAFQLSVYGPAYEKIPPNLMHLLEPDFQQMASAVPDNIQLGGEQITGETATVFVKVPSVEAQRTVNVLTNKDEQMGILKTETRTQRIDPGKLADGTHPALEAAAPKPKIIQDEKSSMAVMETETVGDPQTTDQDTVTLLLINGKWLVGDADTRELVDVHGMNYFFYERAGVYQQMQKNEAAVLQLMNTLIAAETAYAGSNLGIYAPLRDLSFERAVPDEVGRGRMHGYAYTIEVTQDRRGYAVYAEPVEPWKTGRYSYYADPNGVQSGKTGGARFNPNKTSEKTDR